MLGAVLAVLLAFHSGLDSPSKYLFTIPGTNITGDVNLDSPILRAEDLSWLHEAYAERWVRDRCIGSSSNNVSQYYRSATNQHVFLKSGGVVFGTSYNRVSGFRSLEEALTDSAAHARSSYQYELLNYVQGIVGAGGVVKLSAEDAGGAQGEAMSNLCTSVMITDPCFNQFTNTPIFKRSERQAVFTAMGLFDKVAYSGIGMSAGDRFMESSVDKYWAADSSGWTTNYTDTVGPAVKTNTHGHVVQIHKYCDRIRGDRGEAYWMDDDYLSATRFFLQNYSNNTAAVMSDGAYYLNTSNATDGVAVENINAALVVYANVSDTTIIGDDDPEVDTKSGYFTVPVTVERIGAGCWQVGGMAWDDWSAEILSLLDKAEPPDEFSIVQVPPQGSGNGRIWEYTIDSVGLAVSIEFNMRTNIE